MADLPPPPPQPIRRRSRSEIEPQRHSLHNEHDHESDDDLETTTFRRRVVSFTFPSGGSLSYLNQEARADSDLELRKADDGEDLPDGLFRKADATREVRGAGGGGIGGFRRRLKSLSFGLSLSPASSTHDVVTGGTGGHDTPGAASGKLVTSLVRQSLLQAAWPLSVSLEDIEAQQKSGQHLQER